MDTTLPENEKNVATAVHLSTFAKYFFPFGNFLAPLLLWTIHKDKPFVNEHGRQAINFQLSVILYTIVIAIICLPFVIIYASDFVGLVESIDHAVDRVSLHNIRNLSGYVVIFSIAALLLFGLFVIELYAVISATLAASKGQHYKYPLSISFIKSTSGSSETISETEQNQSENEHVS